MSFGRLLGQNLSVSGKVFDIDRPVNLIGRGKDCTVVVLDPSVSRMHTKVSIDDDGRLRVEDLRSSNGTFLNDQRIETAYLRHGDRLRAGNVEFTVELTEEMQQAIDADIARAKGAKGLMAWLVLSLIVLGGLGYGVYFFVLRPDPAAPGWFAVFDGEEGYESKVNRIALKVKEQFIDDKLEQGEELLNKKEYNKALDTYNQLATVAPGNTDVKEGIQKVNRELKAQKAYQDGINALKKEDYANGVKHLKSIPKGSAYHEKAQRELSGLMEVKEEIKRVGSNYCRRGAKTECLKFFKQALAIDPADKELAEKIGKLEK
jgi:pSer/pThr/pTyr-binding forkhead associated (FHA) protein